MIEKKDRDRRFIKNWSPIFLLNIDLKIASKALACRLKKVIGKIIEPDQTAYIKDKNIHESTRLIQDILNYIENFSEEGILFTVDIEKAFDSVDYNLLFAVLKKFGFKQTFIAWIKTLLNKTEACIMNNGWSTGFFKLERGTRQGDHLSAYLFILVLEILFFQIRKSVGSGWEVRDYI